MKYNPVFDAVISSDARGILEYWNPVTLKFPDSGYVFVSVISPQFLEARGAKGLFFPSRRHGLFVCEAHNFNRGAKVNFKTYLIVKTT